MAESNLGNLIAARDALSAELAAGPTKPSYSVGGQSVQWTEYQTALFDRLEKLNGLIQIAGGPVEIVTQGTTAGYP